MLRKLGIEPGEGWVFAWGAAALFLLGWADVSVKNVAETFFLKRVGVELLPLVFLVSSVLLVGTTYMVGRIASQRDRLQLLWRVFLGLAVGLIPLWVLVIEDVKSAFVLLVIASKQLQSISLLAFWVALSDLLNGRQSKRLFAPLMASVTLGTILGSFASEPISRAIGIAGLLPLSAAALAARGRIDDEASPAVDREPSVPSAVRDDDVQWSVGSDVVLPILLRSGPRHRGSGR
jgi:hypothetical protein